MKGIFELVNTKEELDAVLEQELIGRLRSCGGLPIRPVEERRKPPVFSPTCYICRDPEYSLVGLPLCRACSHCGGHIAADDSVCDDCGFDDSDGPEEE